MLWSNDEPLTASEVQSQLSDSLAATTVITILNRLTEKGMVERRRHRGDRAYRYSPTHERAEHAADRMYAFLQTGADHRAVLARFLGRLSATDRRALAELLRRGAR